MRSARRRKKKEEGPPAIMLIILALVVILLVVRLLNAPRFPGRIGGLLPRAEGPVWMRAPGH